MATPRKETHDPSEYRHRIEVIEAIAEYELNARACDRVGAYSNAIACRARADQLRGRLARTRHRQEVRRG